MTKSIEEQAREYVSNFNEIDIDDVGEFGTDIHMFLAGAKARDVQLMTVVNELREALEFYAETSNWKKHGALTTILNDTEFIQTIPNETTQPIGGARARISLTKADQMLKEMNIK